MPTSSYLLNQELPAGSNVGTVLHGAYGDYFEQLLCIVDLAKKHPQYDFHLFFANPHRMKEFEFLDMSFAKTVALHDKIESVEVDTFYQFQIFDQELKDDVISHLSEPTKAKFDFNVNLLPHVYMNTVQETKKVRFDLEFNDAGMQNFNRIKSTLPKDIFKNKTIGFMWRYRAANGAVNPLFMPSEETLKDKYSEVLQKAIEEWDCHVLVAGMKVKTTDENRHMVDAKFPEYGLNFQHENLHYLPGKGWLAEVELIANCDIVICNPSGFSEAIFLKGKDCIVVDPPLHYVVKTLKNGFSLFGIGIKSIKQWGTLFRSVFQRHTSVFLTKRVNKIFGSSD